jgi:sulfatase maturation enzyme AslB (radical SAM superfamily)
MSTSPRIYLVTGHKKISFRVEGNDETSTCIIYPCCPGGCRIHLNLNLGSVYCLLEILYYCILKDVINSEADLKLKVHH